MYYPIISTDDMPENQANISMGNALKKIYNIDPSIQSQYIDYANEHFGRLYSMVRDLHDQLNNTTTKAAWYARDLMTTYDSTSADERCPVFTWNYIDKLVEKYPDRFRIHNNEFGLFSLCEIANNVAIISSADKENAQLWAQNGKATGRHWRWDMLGKRV